MTSNEVLERLKNGNLRFCRDNKTNEKQDSARRQKTVKGQDPFAVILTCADSRVAPELIFDTGIGELFVVRVAGNIANKSTIASIEYAVANLKVPVVLVLSHENCGAVTAAIQGGDFGSNLNHLVEHIKPAIEAAHVKEVNQVARVNATLTVKELLENSSIIQKAVDEEQLQVIPAYYHLGSGKVDYLND